jgi:alkanesulfonate monooxygenase SsuD/methylene tetrahydromethanopterin reductase-like flavin-dependent oxidoreductase (luciferase family)
MSRTLHFALAPLGVGGPVDSQFINADYPAYYLNRLEPLTLLSAVATHTKSIGLVVTASSTYNSPFNLARRLASLDHISHGRAGWNVVTSFDSQVSKNFGLDEHLDYATRYVTWPAGSPRASTRTGPRWRRPRPSTPTSSPAPSPTAVTPITS